MRENRMRRLTWRELEPWLWWNCEPTEQSKELVWKPSTYSVRASSRPYRRGGWWKRAVRHRALSLPYGNAVHTGNTPLGEGPSPLEVRSTKSRRRTKYPANASAVQESFFSRVGWRNGIKHG